MKTLYSSYLKKTLFILLSALPLNLCTAQTTAAPWTIESRCQEHAGSITNYLHCAFLEIAAEKTTVPSDLISQQGIFLLESFTSTNRMSYLLSQQYFFQASSSPFNQTMQTMLKSLSTKKAENSMAFYDLTNRPALSDLQQGQQTYPRAKFLLYTHSHLDQQDTLSRLEDTHWQGLRTIFSQAPFSWPLKDLRANFEQLYVHSEIKWMVLKDGTRLGWRREGNAWKIHLMELEAFLN